jgi:hypothetical protein
MGYLLAIGLTLEAIQWWMNLGWEGLPAIAVTALVIAGWWAL